MKLYTVADQKKHFVAAEHKGSLVDLGAAHQAFIASGRSAETMLPVFPKTMLGLMRCGEAGLQTVEMLLQFVSKRPVLPMDLQVFYPPEDVMILAPLPRPGKILISDPMDFGDQLDYWNFQGKFPSVVNAPGKAVILPNLEQAEASVTIHLGIIFGAKGATEINGGPQAESLPGIFGYTFMLDFVYPAVQPGFTILHHNFPTACPMFNCILSGGDWKKGPIKMDVLLNGKMKEQLTPDFAPQKIISVLHYLSARIGFEAGDVVGIPLARFVPEGKSQKHYLVNKQDQIELQLEGSAPWITPVS
ncbi:MAG: fumarylacetoacetate hydrolase family protein [Verrucomicrobiales bacterium]